MNIRILLVSALLSLAGFQSVAQRNSFTGTWRLQAKKSVDVMGVQSKVRFETLSSDTKARAIEAMDGREFEFSKDGSIAVRWIAGSKPCISRGNWAIDTPAGDLLITIGRTTTPYRYEFRSKTTLILRGKQQKGFFDALYLEKIN